MLSLAPVLVVRFAFVQGVLRIGASAEHSQPYPLTLTDGTKLSDPEA